MRDDVELLRQYAEANSHDAFAELVRRRVDMVYAVALRHSAGNAHAAEEVTQLVFTELARKAKVLSGHPVLEGWLFKTTHYTAAKLMRADARRRRRESEALAMNTDTDADLLDREQIRPVVDDAIMRLPERDREAVLLRFFTGLGFAELGARLNLTEEGARSRVTRALDRMQKTLARRGITSTSSALATTLGAQAGSAPAGLAAAVAQSAVALGGGTTMGALISGILVTPVGAKIGLTSLMMTTKAYVWMTAGLGVLAVGFSSYQYTEAKAGATAVAQLEEEMDRLQEQLKAYASIESRGQSETAPAAASPVVAASTNASADPASLESPSQARDLYLRQKVAELKRDVGPVFKSLGLTDEQWIAYQQIIREMQEIMLDEAEVSRSAGLTPRQREAALADTYNEVRANLVRTIGSEANAKLIEHNQNLRFNKKASQLAADLMFSATPLTDAQAEAYRAFLEANFHKLQRTAGGELLVPSSFMAELQSFLAPAQIEVLEAQQELIRLERQAKRLAESE